VDESTGQLRILFSQFTWDAEIINIGRDAIAAYQSLEIYANLGEREHLNITRLHLTKLYLLQARLLGRIDRAIYYWYESVHMRFTELINVDEIKKVKSEFEKSIDDLRIEFDKSMIDSNMVLKIFIQYFRLFTPEYFPSKTWLKCGYVAQATKGLLRELQLELAYPNSAERDRDLFVKEYAQAFLLDLRQSRIEQLRELWSEKYSVRRTVPDWKEDELNDLLTKIDFNLGGFSKALVRVAGIAVCIAGAAGKVASIITVNPFLNDIAIRGMYLGAALAVAPMIAMKLASKLLTPEIKNHPNNSYYGTHEKEILPVPCKIYDGN